MQSRLANKKTTTCHAYQKNRLGYSLAAPDPKKRVWWNCVQKVWRCRNVGSSNQIAPFQIDYVMRIFQKIRGLQLITSGDSAA